MIYRIFLLVVFLAIAIGGGAASVWFALEKAPLTGRHTAGPWEAFPLVGTPEADPYSRARHARFGGLPLGPSEGITLYAREDSGGRPLRGNCTYLLSGLTPPARLWTLHATDAEGRLLPGIGERRAALHSGMITRAQDNRFTISVSARPQPGNWLAVNGGSRMRIVLTLLDTPVAAASELSDVQLPAIISPDCDA